MSRGSDMDWTSSCDWQSNKSLIECNQYMLENEVACDIEFRVGPEENIKSVWCHKHVLISRSPVFLAMFCGRLRETDTAIRVPDIEPAAFQQMLRFCYCDDVNLGPEVALPTLYAAKKYLLPALVSACVQWLKESLDPTNVCEIFEHSVAWNEPSLTEECVCFIEQRTEDVLTTQSFLEISQEGLCRVLHMEHLSSCELDIYRICVSWSKEECLRQSKEVTPENQRSVLGNALNLIRFPNMLLGDFSNEITPTGLLTAAEKCSVFEYVTRSPTPLQQLPLTDMPFPTSFRCFVRECFINVKRSAVMVMDGFTDTLYMYANARILFRGFGVSSCQKAGPLWKVMVSVCRDIDEEDVDKVLLHKAEIKVKDEQLVGLVDVPLPPSIVLRPHTWYRVRVSYHFHKQFRSGYMLEGAGLLEQGTSGGVHISLEVDEDLETKFIRNLRYARV